MESTLFLLQRARSLLVLAPGSIRTGGRAQCVQSSPSAPPSSPGQPGSHFLIIWSVLDAKIKRKKRALSPSVKRFWGGGSALPPAHPPVPLLGKTRCGVICLYFSCCRLMSPGCGGFGGLGMGLVGVPGALWAAGTCSVPPLSKPQSEQGLSRGTLQLPPSAGASPGVPWGWRCWGAPRGWGQGH